MYTDLILVYLHALILVPYTIQQDGASFMPVFDTSTINLTVIQGRTAYLNCTVDYRGDYKVAWLNPENKVLTNLEKRIIDDTRIALPRNSLNDWTLYIREIQHYDEGVYSCSINTDPVQTKKVYLKVLVPARIIDHGTSHDIQEEEGKTVQLICNATGIPTPTVQWFRHIPKTSYEKATKEGKAVVEPGEVLLIHNISRYCGGTYECIAFNRVDKADSHQIEVEVIFRPEIELPNRRFSQYLYKETILQCIVRANPIQFLEWQRNGIRIESSTKYRVDLYDDHFEINTKILDLNIHSIQKEDYGNYTCVASNNLGKDRETMILYEAVELTKPPLTTTKLIPTTKQTKDYPSYEVYENKKRPEKQKNGQPTRGNYRPRSSGLKVFSPAEHILFCFILIRFCAL
ncbi:HNT [Mytilus coruscus]|uniref:HNT n=1 Tax=Mytilus coruscus TaxID=42192 RepID=A0A6J8CBN5_MYTCO|nr:HNT [Mytilus coruscus]